MLVSQGSTFYPLTDKGTVPSLMTGPRVREAMERSVRWLDRCVAYHKASGKDSTQNLFAIIQGGLDEKLRLECLQEMVKRKEDVPGYAIGGLSGGEEKRMSCQFCVRRSLTVIQRYFGKC